MLLGRDFGTKSYYDRLVGSPPRDENTLTWRHTRDIHLSGLRPSFGNLPVWCTNYLMGVRLCGPAKGNVKECMSNEAWFNFEASCWNFLQKQVLLQKPLVIVIFGGDNHCDLAAANRFDRNGAEPFQHIFVTEGKYHEASIFYANHPHSLIKPIAKLAAQHETEKIRAFYLSLLSGSSKNTSAGTEGSMSC